MAAISQISKNIFLEKNFCILIWIAPKFVPTGPIDNKSLLVEVNAWRRPGEKPFSELMLTQFPIAYLWC